MSIKQNGGVFGRNPTFNDVTINYNLTVNGTLKSSALKLGDIAPSYNVLLSARNAGGSFEWGHPNNSGYPSTMGAETGSGSPYIAFNAGPGTNGNTYKTLGLLGTVVKTDTAGNLRIGRLTNANADNQTPTESAVFTNSGNVQFPSGQGIDFSPTAGAGTSELLDDYEEGVWTPADGSGAGLSFSSIAGVYTKIGRTVFATGFANYPVTSNSAATKISGLPFTALSSNARGVGSISYKQTASADTIMIDNNASTLAFFTATGSATTNAQLSNTKIYFGLVYNV